MVYDLRNGLKTDELFLDYVLPNTILMNGKAPFKHPKGQSYESFTVTKGKTYQFRISNVGTELSLNFRIQNHQLVLVETEGSYANQITLDSLDVYVGQSYSVLVTANQNDLLAVTNHFQLK
ncbi:hypothetical protein Sjap_013715 [Stephania japonica]|uniref:Plastocyanin-like domain-containing protein n=1 Tax=Stephania japonica TaxID=461633 RepID=A0AAP0J085_9MAGN